MKKAWPFVLVENKCVAQSNFDNMVAMEIKDALSCLRQFYTTGSLLEKMKNTFYFTLKALFCSQDI